MPFIPYSPVLHGLARTCVDAIPCDDAPPDIFKTLEVIRKGRGKAKRETVLKTTPSLLRQYLRKGKDGVRPDGSYDT